MDMDKMKERSKVNPMDEKKSALIDEFSRLQLQIDELGIPVLIMIDGWESSGKGYVLNDLIKEANHRQCKVYEFEEPTDEERERPFLYRFWRAIPPKGGISVFDRSVYYHIMDDPDMEEDRLEQACRDIESFERQCSDDHMVILKFFLDITEKTQKERVKDHERDKFRRILVTDRDRYQVANHESAREHFTQILNRTNFEFSPWQVIDAEDLKEASMQILSITLREIQNAIDRFKDSGFVNKPLEKPFKTGENRIEAVNYDQSIDRDEYKVRLKELQEEMLSIGYELHMKKIPMILVFEGMDAGGKGGAIQRLASGIDPRIYEVIPIAKPTEEEYRYHYMWRFWNTFPKNGRFSIYDRSWYGRVLVERIEGFATREEWTRAYREIVETEQHLSNHQTIILKFLLVIDKDEQLKRFNDRVANPDKEHKITAEDWRNREKWPKYMTAMNDMIENTSTCFAPWVIVEGNDKRYARIKVLETVIDHAKKALRHHDEAMKKSKHKNKKEETKKG